MICQELVAVIPSQQNWKGIGISLMVTIATNIVIIFLILIITVMIIFIETIIVLLIAIATGICISQVILSLLGLVALSVGIMTPPDRVI